MVSDLIISNSAPRSSPSRVPIIVIVGATGTGKSKLAIALSEHLSRKAANSDTVLSASTQSKHDGELAAEIINADAMQLYNGLPVITNKLPDIEQNGIPHHLLGRVPLEAEPWTVNRYVKEADACISGIKERGRLPIVVGGTGYYIHGLMLDGTTLKPNESEGIDPSREHISIAHEHSILSASTEEMYARLQEIDPVVARRWHPNDRRKIQRSLEIHLKTGRRASDTYADQKSRSQWHDTSRNTGGENAACVTAREDNLFMDLLRYNPLVFWLEAEDKTLKERLDKRVESMLANGLTEEVKEMSAFAKSMATSGLSIDKTKGIWVSIGFKEMKPWLDRIGSADLEDNTESILAVRESCIESIKAATRRYAKRQNRYIRIRLAHALAEAGIRDRLVMLDCSSLEQWHELVVRPAVEVLDLFLQGEALPKPEEMSELAKRTFESMYNNTQEAGARIAKKCETCNKVLMTEQEWNRHVTSRSHKRVLDGLRKRTAREARERKLKTDSP